MRAVGMGEGEEKTNGLGRVWRAFRFFFCRKTRLPFVEAQLVKCARMAGLMSATQGLPRHLCRQNANGVATQRGRSATEMILLFSKKETVANHFARALPRNDCLLRLKEASKMMWELSLAPEACHFGAFSRLRGLGLRSPKPLWAKYAQSLAREATKASKAFRRVGWQRGGSLPFLSFTHPTKQKKARLAAASEVYYGLKETYICLSLSFAKVSIFFHLWPPPITANRQN